MFGQIISVSEITYTLQAGKRASHRLSRIQTPDAVLTMMAFEINFFTRGAMTSHIEAEVYDVSVHDDVFLPLQAQAAGRFYLSGGSATGDEFIVMHHLRLDKASFKIVMNRARRFGGFGPFRDYPGLDFVIAHGKKTDAPQQ